MWRKKTLGDLRPGQSGTVLRVGGQGAIKRKLVDMGITPSVRISVRKKAPLGDPIEVELWGFALLLRRDDAVKIEME